MWWRSRWWSRQYDRDLRFSARQQRLQSEAIEQLNPRIAEKNVALTVVHFMRPARRTVRIRPRDSDVAVTSQEGVGVPELAAWSDEITDVLISKNRESIRRKSCIGWANEQARIHQFVRKHLQMPE